MSSFVRPLAVRAACPSLADNSGDLDRLIRAVREVLGDDRPVEAPLARVSILCRCFRGAGFQGTALVSDLGDRWLLTDFLAERPKTLMGVALDLGTTQLEATLVNMIDGQILARANRINDQIEYGSDILSRIHFATASRRLQKSLEPAFIDPGLVTLQEVIRDCLNNLLAELAAQADVEPGAIRALAVAGNTTMIHFLLGLDPYHLCREPYIPMLNQPGILRAEELRLALHPAAPVWIMPSIGSYFGGDLISGILASGLTDGDEPRMLIDVGTNAEVVVGNREWLIACAGAAGPALEGGVARMGMRAGPGAIDRVNIDPLRFELSYSTIGNVPARGICGSGLIDLVAALYLSRIIDIQGRLRDPVLESDPDRLAFMGDRVIESGSGRAFVVVPAAEASGDEPVLLEQLDLDALMRSKAAMYAILTTLLGQVGLEFSDLREICVAGAFGGHIDPQRAVTLGMLPDLDLSVYRGIGNSSLQGAERVLCEGAARRACAEIVARITYVELNVNQEFMIRFSGSRFIPHTDPSLFPSVPFYNENS